jgi:hypothetical protein
MTTPAPQELTVKNASGTFTMQATDFGTIQSTTGEWDVIVFNGGTPENPVKVGAFSGVDAVYWSAEVTAEEEAS